MIPQSGALKREMWINSQKCYEKPKKRKKESVHCASAQNREK